MRTKQKMITLLHRLNKLWPKIQSCVYFVSIFHQAIWWNSCIHLPYFWLEEMKNPWWTLSSQVYIPLSKFLLHAFKSCTVDTVQSDLLLTDAGRLVAYSCNSEMTYSYCKIRHYSNGQSPKSKHLHYFCRLYTQPGPRIPVYKILLQAWYSWQLIVLPLYFSS